MSGRLLAVVIILLVLAAGVAAALGLLSSKPNSAVSAQSVKPATYATDANAQVEFDTMGPVVANESYRSGSIIITPTSRTISVYATYLSQPQSSQSYDNNPQAFEQFMNALQVSQFTTQQRGRSTQAQVKSTCPTGTRYILKLIDNGATVSNLWATTCGTTTQTFGGNLGLTNTLFQRQIPGISKNTAYLQIGQSTGQ